MGALEITSEEVPGESLDQDVKTEVAAVQPDARIGDARRRDAGCVKHAAADILRAVARILNGVVQMDLLQAMKTLAGDKLSKAQRQRRFVVNLTKAPRSALEMDGHVGENHVPLADDCRYKFPRILAQRRQICFCDFNLQPQHRGVGGKNVRPAFGRRRLDSVLLGNRVHFLQPDY